MTEDREHYLIKSIVSAAELLKSFEYQGETLRLKQIVERSGFTKAKAFRLVFTLERCGFIERVGDKLYRSTVRAQHHRKFKIGYAWPGEDYLFARDVIESVLRAAKAEEIQVVLANNRYNAKTAVRNVDMLIREGIDLAMEFQTDTRVAPIISAKYRDAGIPLIAIEIPHPGATFYGANNYQAGLIAGRYAARWAKTHWLEPVDEIVLLGLPRAGSLPAARIEGLLTGVNEIRRSQQQLQVSPLNGDGKFETSFEAVRKHLRGCQSRRIIVGAINDPSALGALRAFEECGNVERCVVVGQNASPEARAELRKKTSGFIGSVAYFPERYGDDLIPMALDILHRKVVPPAVFIKHQMIHAANVNHLYPNDSLLNAVTEASHFDTVPRERKKDARL